MTAQVVGGVYRGKAKAKSLRKRIRRRIDKAIREGKIKRVPHVNNRRKVKARKLAAKHATMTGI